MLSSASAYLFLLGLACGLTLLTLSAFRHLSPGWPKWLMVAGSLFVLSRYLALLLFTIPDAPQRFWGFRHCWFATSLVFPLQSAFAVDQLVRHPAMTPKKLLKWLAPFLASYTAVILFARMEASPDLILGWTIHLSSGWQRLLSITHTLFLAGLLWMGFTIIRQIPSSAVRWAVIGLMAGFLYLGADGLILATGHWYFRPYLFSEMLVLVALWHAFETASSLQA
jgi:hypothetical protein